MSAEPQAHEQVEVEDAQGRILAGVGVTPESLQQAIDSHDAKAEPASGGEAGADAAAAAVPGASAVAVDAAPATDLERDDDTGRFKKREGKGRERFSALTTERDSERDRANRLQAELDELRAAQTRAFEQPKAAPTNGNGNGHAPAPTAAPPSEPQFTRPQPRVDDIGTKYQTYEDFIYDVSRWQNEQTVAQAMPAIQQQIDRAIGANRAEQMFYQSVDRKSLQTSIDRGKQKYPDFAAVIAASSVEMPWPVMTLIGNHPQSEDLQYKLAKNPTVAQIITLAHQAGDQNTVDILLAGLAPPIAAASPASTARAGVTNAPAPYQPVGSGSKTTVPPLEELARSHGDDYDSSGYRERRAQERKTAR